MNKNKRIITSIAIVILIIIIGVGATYAFFIASTNSGNATTNTGELDIIYDPFDPLTGNLMSSPNRSTGLSASATASLATGSVDALFSMSIIPTLISDELKTNALVWEVEGVRNGSIVCSGRGNFSSAVVGVPIEVFANGCDLDTEVTTFTVYIWLNENLISSSINDASFNATINVNSVPITGEY